MLNNEGCVQSGGMVTLTKMCLSNLELQTLNQYLSNVFQEQQF